MSKQVVKKGTKKQTTKKAVKKKQPAKKIPHVRTGHDAVSIYLTVSDSSKAIEFYKKAFGAREVGRLVMKNGMIGHAEVKIEGKIIMLADENKEWGNLSPETLNGSPVSISVYVKNVDNVFKKAIDAGGKQVMPVSDQFYGDRMGVLLDPFGHKWSIVTHKENVSFKEMQKRMDALY